MTNHEPKHPPADMAGLDGLIEDLRCVGRDGVFHAKRPEETHPICEKAATQLEALAERVKVLEAENERLRKALELIHDPANVYYAGEMRAFARAALGEKQ